jgi:hypothetical protein
MNATTTPGVGLLGADDHVLAFERKLEIVDLEGDVRDGLDEIGIRSVGVVALPLDPEPARPVIADGHLEVRQRDLSVKALRRRYSDVVEPQHPAIIVVGPIERQLGADDDARSRV